MKKNYKLTSVLPLLVLMFLTSYVFGQEVVNTDFGPDSGVFTVEFDVVPSDAPMNGGVGLSDVTVGTWGDMACIVGFHPGGIIRAYNSSGYEYINEITYAAGTSYHIAMDVDVPNKTYSVVVTPDGGTATVLATDYGFRTGATVLNNYASYNDTNTDFGGVPGATLDISNYVYTASPTVVTSYTEDFESPVSLDLWRPNGITHPDGTAAFDVTQDGGVLNEVVNQVNFYDGQFFNFTTHENLIFDITGNPYITFDVKVEPGATYGGEAVDTVAFLVSPWGPNADGALMREFLAINMGVPADGQWHTMRYDISQQFGLPDWDGTILENDYSEIQAILVENVIWPDTYSFSMQLDNFKVGDAAAPPTVVTSYTEDFESPVSLDLWRPNGITHPDGTAAFDVIQDGGVLNEVVNQVNFYDGQFFNFTTHENLIFDITGNPYITFDVKVEPGATYGGEAVDTVAFLVSPWGPNADGALMREFLAINMGVPADGQWHTMRYDISQQFGLPDWDGTILENDYSEIQAILVENVIWPDTYSFTMQFDNFKVGDAAAPPTVVTSYTEDFESPVSLDLWRPNGTTHPDGTPAFDVTQDGGVLNEVVNQVNFYDGQFFNFTKHENLIFDITGNPYISFDVKVEPGATYGGEAVDTVAFLVSPWGPNADGALMREFLAINMGVPADGQWHTMVYDISQQFGLPDWDGTILENDYSEIQAILMENVIWPDTYSFTMQFDNFKVGDAAAPPTVVTSYTEDFESPVSLDLWRPNGATHPDGTPAFDITQDGGVLNEVVNQVNFYDGQFFNFTTHENLIFDITGNPYISFDVKIEPGATYGGEAVDTVAFLVSPWGPNADGALMREFLAINMGVPADGQWHTMVYDISQQFGLPDWDGTILENDYSEIQAILVENVIWPDTYSFSMQFDNFKVGDAAVPPTVVTTYYEDFEEPVDFALWRPNGIEHPDGTPAFDIIQDGGVLNEVISQVNFYDGQFFNFTKNQNIIMDITDNPFIAFDVKIEPGATYGGEAVDTVAFLVSPWGPNADRALMREFLAINMGVPADGEWHTMRYNISEQDGLPDWDGTILENDYSEIQAILVENVIWPDTYAFTMQFDNFRVGEAAVGTYDVENRPFFKVYPNPVSNNLIIEAEEDIEVVSVFDVHGRLVTSYDGDAQKTVSIDLSKLVSGLYLIEANSAGKVSTRKVLKN